MVLLLFYRVLIAFAATAGLLALSTHGATATTVTYSDRATFLAASGPISAYGFDTDPAGAFASKDFGGFRATALTGASRSTRLSLGGGELVLDQNFNRGGPLLEWTFDGGITAVGFDFRNTDTSLDFSEIEIAGKKFQVGGPLTEGFFGAIWDGPVTTLRFWDDPDGGGNLAHVRYDNLAYATAAVQAPTPAPLPAGIWLLLGALLSLACLGRASQRSP